MATPTAPAGAVPASAATPLSRSAPSSAATQRKAFPRGRAPGNSLARGKSSGGTAAAGTRCRRSHLKRQWIPAPVSNRQCAPPHARCHTEQALLHACHKHHRTAPLTTPYLDADQPSRPTGWRKYPSACIVCCSTGCVVDHSSLLLLRLLRRHPIPQMTHSCIMCGVYFMLSAAAVAGTCLSATPLGPCPPP